MIVVTVYTQPHCVQCTYTKKRLDNLGITYAEEPIDDDVRAAAIELDITTAPIVCVSVDGVESYWGGYKPDRIDALVRGAA